MEKALLFPIGAGVFVSSLALVNKERQFESVLNSSKHHRRQAAQENEPHFGNIQQLLTIEKDRA